MAAAFVVQAAGTILAAIVSANCRGNGKHRKKEGGNNLHGVVLGCINTCGSLKKEQYKIAVSTGMLFSIISQVPEKRDIVP